MKKSLKLIACFAILLFVNTAYTQAQTSFELQCKGYEDGHYVAIKGQEVEKDAKYSYIFSNLTSYKIKVLDTEDPKSQVSVKIFSVDENEQEKEVTSNFNPKNKKYLHTMIFKCGKTGRYHIKFEKIANN